MFSRSQGSLEKIENKSSFFFYTVAVLLLFTATAKAMSFFGNNTRYLSEPDPLFNEFSSFFVTSLAITLEIVVVICLFLLHSVQVKAFLLLWLSTCFVGYRIGIWYYYPTWSSCGCMGSFSEWTGLAEKTVDQISLFILIFMIAGSIITIILNYIVKSKKIISSINF